MKKIRFLIIGVGYHARRIYIPYVVDKNDTELSALYDLDSQKKVIEDYLINKKLSISAYYTNNSEISDTLTKEEVESLNNIIKEKNINAVIISTEPLAHFKYAKWAIDSDLHIVMDKPITTEIDISTKNIKAKKLYEDYLKLKKLYKKKKNKLVFILQAQRRFHVGYQKVRDLILETSNKTNCPVTSMEVFHSDGMWRLPKEIIDMDYHPYNQGYGKVSHSGYHSIDIALWFVKASIISPEKKVNEIEVYSSFLRPVDFFKQITYNRNRKK